MSYYVVTRWGDSIDDPNEQQMRDVLRELDTEDEEHPDCWLTHDSGWTLSVFEGGRVAFTNDERGLPSRHIPDVSREKVLQLWLRLAAGELDVLEREAWEPGTHVPLSDEELRARREEAEQWALQRDREFYESLGPEDESRRCRHDGCMRGSVQFSLFCRDHHFRGIEGKSPPLAE